MNIIKCLNCGHEFFLKKIYGNNEGSFTICPECGSSFETDKEVELSDRQSKRVDEVYNAVYEMCKTLTENENLEWDMYFIG
jgi:transcription elongation factor Elf1